MADTVRTHSELDALFADNTAGDISAQDLRDGFQSVDPEVYGVYNVMRDGAKGDGATDDTTAIQTTIDAAEADTDGGVVFFPPGTYITSSDLTVNSDNVTIQGAGPHQSIIKAAASHTGRGFLVQNCDNITIRDLTVDMNKAATTDQASVNNQQSIYVVVTSGTTNDVTIDNCILKNSHQRNLAVVESSGTLERFVLRNSTIQDSNGIGAIIGSPHGRIENNHFKSCGATDGKETLYVGGNHTTIVGNHIEDGGWNGIVAYNNRGLVINNNIIEGCTRVGTYAYAIAMFIGVFDATISGNVIRDCDNGISMDVKDATTTVWECNFTVTGNTIYNITDASAHGIYANYATGINITGNVTNTVAGSGISLNNCEEIVVGSHMSLNDGKGIAVNAGVGNHFIGQFICVNPTSAVYSDSGTTPSRWTHLDFLQGTGTPESVVTAPVGARFMRTDGGANTTLYIKESGTGNTGWAAI